MTWLAIPQRVMKVAVFHTRVATASHSVDRRPTSGYAQRAVKADADWTTMLAELEAFGEHYGHLRVEEKQEFYRELADWWLGIRGRLERLTYEQILGLDNLGFFDRHERCWLDRYAQLRAFREKAGHCNVPFPQSGSRSLHGWVVAQRSKRTRTTAWHRKLLNDMGFDWNPLQSIWEKRCRELEAFKAQHGHCLVPDKSGPLGFWVSNLRQKKKGLSAAQIRRLDEIGFDWAPYETEWQVSYNNLMAFRREIRPRKRAAGLGRESLSGSLGNRTAHEESEAVAGTGCDAGGGGS